MDDELTIGALARRSGVPPSTLRYYERLGLLTPRRRVGGWRHYGPDALPRLAAIRAGQRAGFRLVEIRELLGAGPDRDALRVRARRKLAEVRDEIAGLEARRRLLEASLACDCPTVVACLAAAAAIP